MAASAKEKGEEYEESLTKGFVARPRNGSCRFRPHSSGWNSATYRTQMQERLKKSVRPEITNALRYARSYPTRKGIAERGRKKQY